MLDGAKRPVAIVGSQLRQSRDREALARFVSVRATGVSQWPRSQRARSKALLHVRALAPRNFRRPMWRSSRTPFDFRVDYGREGTWAPDVIVQVDLGGPDQPEPRRRRRTRG